MHYVIHNSSTRRAYLTSYRWSEEGYLSQTWTHTAGAARRYASRAEALIALGDVTSSRITFGRPAVVRVR